MARKDDAVAERRKVAIARFLDAAQWVSGDFGIKVPTPTAARDVEIQRIGLLEYAADVLDAVRESRQAERSSKAPEAKPAKAEAKAAKGDK